MIDILAILGKMSSMKTDYRAGKMKALYSQGLTLDKIGQQFGVSRQRVQQILSANGITGINGGATVIRIERNIKRLEDERRAANKNEEWARRVFGCSFSEYLALGGKTRDSSVPSGVYCSHKANARKRGIEHCLSLPEWWKIWSESGHWHERGSPHKKKNTGLYVMARYGDSGPYSAENVRIIKWQENSAEAREMDKIIGRTVGGGKRSHCKHGHELTPENRGASGCRMCARVNDKAYRERRRGR